MSKMKKLLDHKLLLLPLAIIISLNCKVEINNTDYSKKNEKYSDFESRRKMIIDSIADWANTFTLEDFKNSDNYNGGKYGAYPIMALFERGSVEKARQFAAHQLIGGAAMFREFSTMALYMEYHHLYDEELLKKVKQDQLNSNFFHVEAEWSDRETSESHRNPRLGGASENHKLMYAAAAYLAGIAWPDDYPEEWYQIGYDHLMKWFEIVTSIGFWEQDSPTYLIHHLGPILSVADHAPEGSDMKKRATMVLDWYFASIAGEYLKGYWITATARDHNPLFGLAISAESTALTWLMFGDATQVANPHTSQPYRHWKATLHFAVSDYRIPDILQRIATDRDQPHVHKEFMAKNPMLPKEYCYINSTYGMASILNDEGNIVPDMTRWKVQWVANEPNKEPSVFLMKHPNLENNWKNWQGASPSEQVLQHEDALIAVYKIGNGEKNFIEGPFIEDVYEKFVRKNDWMFMHTGANLLAVKAINGLELTEEKRPLSNFPELNIQVLKSYGERNGLIVQTADLKNYKAESVEETLNKFIEAVLKTVTIDTSGIRNENPKLVYKSLSGDLLEIEFDNYKKVNGKALQFENWPLLGNPWMHQDYKGNNLVLEHSGEKWIYDFKNWEVRFGDD